MKKSIFALPIVAGAAAAAVAGTSHYAGSQTQTEYQNLLVQLNELTPFVFENEEYESGLGSSTALTRVMASSDADAEVLFRLQHDIKHAAVRVGGDGMAIGTVTIDTSLHDSTELDPALIEAMTDDVPFTLTTDVRMGGEVSNQLRITGTDFDKDGASGSWSGVDFETVTKGNSTVGSGSLGVADFQDAVSGAMFSVEQNSFEFDIETFGDLIYTGNGKLEFEKLSLVSPELPVPVEIDSVLVSSDSSMNDDSMNSNAIVSLDGIDSPLPINKASIEVNVDDLLVEGLREYNQFFLTASSDPEELMGDPEFMKSLGAALRNIVKPGSGLEYKIALANNEGDVDANLRIGVKTEGMSADALDNITTGRELLNILSVDGELDADTSALSQTPVMMMLGGAGEFLTVTDESIKSEISLNGTTLVINGVELPLDMMAAGMLDVPFTDLMQM